MKMKNVNMSDVVADHFKRRKEPDAPFHSDHKKTKQTIYITIALVLAFLFFALLFYHNTWNQSDVFFGGGADYLADAINTERYASKLDPYGYHDEALRDFPHSNYPPLAYIFFFVMDHISFRGNTSTFPMIVATLYMAFSLMFLFFYTYGLIDAPRHRRALLAFALFASAPILFSFERGNIIMLSAALCAFFLYGYRDDHAVVRELSFIALAIAAALKVYPALLGLLLVADRRWKESIRLIVYGLIFSLAPFLLLRGGFGNIPFLLRNLQAHVTVYDRSIYPRCGFRMLASILVSGDFLRAEAGMHLSRIGEAMYRYMPALDILLVLGNISTILFCKVRWKQVAAVMLILVNYPVNSGAYSYLYLLPVIALFLSDTERRPLDWLYFLLFIVIMNPVQVPMPFSWFGLSNLPLINATYILAALSAYLAFVLSALRGYACGWHMFKTKQAAKSIAS